MTFAADEQSIVAPDSPQTFETSAFTNDLRPEARQSRRYAARRAGVWLFSNDS